MIVTTPVPEKMILIAGPCQIESHSHCMGMASALVSITKKFPQIDFVFKASYDKANRTSVDSPRGVGRQAGLQILEDIRFQFACRVTSDVHEVADLLLIEDFIDVVQIPALLSRQTDLLVCAARAPIVNIKKQQGMAPADMAHAVAKVRSVDSATEVWVTERGTTFGYHDLVVDMRSLVDLRRCGADKIIFDASHSNQSPGSNGTNSGGNRRFIEPLARAALAVGVDGLFIEVHDNPGVAFSDGEIAFPLGGFERLLERLLEVWEIGKRYRHSSPPRFEEIPEQVHG